MPHWASAFTVMQVINNHIIGPHRNTGGPHSALDIIGVIRTYTGAHIHLTNCPYNFHQSPGSLFAFCAPVFEHKVTTYEGDRISFTWFIKEVIYQWACIPEIPWVQEGDILNRL